MMHSVHHFGALIRFILKRDRLWLALWAVGLLVLATFFTPMIKDIVGDETAQSVLVETMSSPAMVAICGLFYGDSFTYGALYAQFMLVWSVLGFAVMSIMLVVRHTRKDEEEGRAELIGALPVGRNAGLVAVLVVATLANVLLGLLVGLIIPLFGIEGMDLPGAMAFGFALAANGLFFMGLTAVFAQLFSTSRGAMGGALVVLGAAFLLRAAGDVGSEALALLSPIGLVERSEAFVSNYAWPGLILVAAALVLSLAAFVLSAVRSSGQGMLPARTGRVHASLFLGGALGLSWRLSRVVIVAWAIAVTILAASYGAVFSDIGAFVESNPLYAAMLGVEGDMSAIMDPVIASMTLIMSVTAAIPVAVIVLRLKAEEGRGRMEQLLALPLSRTRLIVCEALIAFVLAFVLQALTALSMWGAAASVMDEPQALGLYFGAAMGFLPAVLAVAGLGILIVGAAPRLSPLVWVYLVYAFFAAFLGGVFDLPAWAENISVFGLLPRYPMEAIEPLLTVALCGVSVLLVAAGAAAYRQRDAN
jgi:ABC-2 type transport system permease protein